MVVRPRGVSKLPGSDRGVQGWLAMAYTGTVVVIPTRNRAALAMNAIRSVLHQPVENVEVMVSDNSTSETEREALANYCAAFAGKHLRYVRPRSEERRVGKECRSGCAP